MLHTCSLSTWAAEAKRLLWVQGQPEPQSNALAWETRQLPVFQGIIVYACNPSIRETALSKVWGQLRQHSKWEVSLGYLVKSYLKKQMLHVNYYIVFIPQWWLINDKQVIQCVVLNFFSVITKCIVFKAMSTILFLLMDSLIYVLQTMAWILWHHLHFLKK